MTEQKKPVDWELVERDFRAGIMSLREMGELHGCTEGAIRKRAKRDGWTRNLSAKIQQKAQEKVQREEVRKEQVRTGSTQLTPADERTVVEVYSQKVADIDLTNRSDLQSGLDIIRGLTAELALLSRPEFASWLNELGEACDETYTTESGRVVKDKFNELYCYIVGIQGRIKMVKDLAGAIGVYIPLQRKVVGLDGDTAKSDVDDLLLKLAQEKGFS